jgi:hypothetical protein
MKSILSIAICVCWVSTSPAASPARDAGVNLGIYQVSSRSMIRPDITSFRIAGGAGERSISPTTNNYGIAVDRNSDRSVDAISGSHPKHLPISVVVAARKTAARRSTDSIDLAHGQNLNSVADLRTMRIREDALFERKARTLSHIISKELGVKRISTEFAQPRTGEDFLDALVAASRRGPIKHLVVYGHAASTGLYMLEDRGFYQTVGDVAKVSPLVDGPETEKEKKLRYLGARDLADLENLVKEGKIIFTSNAIIVFAGCGVAGAKDVEPVGIASRVADITGATVVGSIGLTDESMVEALGPSGRFEYSTGAWVRFESGAIPKRLDSNVLDVVQQLIIQ